MRKVLILGSLLLTGELGHSVELKVVRGELGSGRFYLPCDADGVLGSCLLDTGSTFSSIADLGAFSAYPVTGKVRFKGASGKPVEADEISLRSFQVDTLELNDFKVARLDPKAGFESVVGMDAISASPFAFRSYPSPELTVNPVVTVASSLELEVYEKNIFSVPVNLGDSRTQALWDSGAGLSAIDNEYVSSNPHEFTFIANIPGGKDSTGNPVSMKLYAAKKILVGKHLFENEHVLAIDFQVIRQHISEKVRMILGFNIISKANWYFDVKSKKWLAE